MTFVKLRVSDTYRVPDVISKLTCDETEAVLDTTAMLMASHSTTNTKELKTQIVQTLKQSYDKKIENIKDAFNQEHKVQLDSLQYQLQTLTNQNKLLKEHLQTEKENFLQQSSRDNEFLKQVHIKDITLKDEAIAQLTEQLSQQRKLLFNEKQSEIDQIKSSIASQYTEQITKLKESLLHVNEQLSQQRESIKQETQSVYQSQLDEKVTQLQQLRSDIETERQSFQEALRRYDKMLEAQTSNDQSKLLLKQQQDLIQQLQPVIKFHTGTNEEKGSLGEQSVMNVIKNDMRYADAKVLDTSGQTASGDFHMHWDKLKCMFEIKNKKTLTLEDMNKFERDVKESSSVINCAIFVSLKTDMFPNRSREIIQLDMINNIPVIYTYLSDPIQIHYSIICIRNILNSSNNNDEQTQKLLAYFQRYTKDVCYYYSFFTKQLKQKQNEIRNIQKEISKLGILDEELSKNVSLLVDVNNDSASTNLSDNETEPETNTNNDTKSTTTDKKQSSLPEHETLNINNIDEATNQVVDYFIAYNLATDSPINITNITEHFSISATYLLKKLGGIKHIQQLARTKIFHDLISSDIINKLYLYKTANGFYPKRPELVKKYISQRTLAKLGKVFRAKRIMDTLYAMIDKITDKKSDSCKEVKSTNSDHESESESADHESESENSNSESESVNDA